MRQEMEKHKESLLLKQITEALYRKNKCMDQPNIKFYHELDLQIIQKKPLYLADSKFCIQSSFNTIEEPPKPFNKLTTPYYAPVMEKPHILFNCHAEDVPKEAVKYPPPYHPCFYFKNYDNFLNFRNQAKVLVSCEKIKVKEWKLAIVNVSNSGYYAPILVILSFERSKSPSSLDHPVENILFCPSMKAYLERLRASDMKKVDYPADIAMSSMIYHLKEGNNSTGASHKSPFVSLDYEKNFIKCNEQRKISYVPLGSASGFCPFMRKIPGKYLETFTKKKEINFSKIPNFQEDSDIDTPFQEMSLWSEDEELEPSEGEKEDRMENRMEEREVVEIDSDSSDEDPLKSVYQKEIDKRRDTFI